jgi:hypothetical protein
MSLKDVSMPHEEPDSGAKKPVLLITGASSGIGAATARLASHRYWLVFAGAVKGATRRKLAPEVRDAAVSARPWQAVAVAETAGSAGDAGEACGGRAGGVAGMKGSSRRRAERHGTSGLENALHEFTTPWCGEFTQRGSTLPGQGESTQRDLDGHISVAKPASL